MKKVLCFMIPIVILVLSISVYFSVSITNSPEYALMQIANDIKELGVDGLTPHLTEEAQKMVSTIKSITENKFVYSILSIFNEEDYVGVLKSNLKDIEWTVDNVSKSKEKADVVLRFNYNNKLIGTLGIDMIQEEGKWKICAIELPDFETIDFDN